MAHRGPSPALVISCFALFVALGGISVAEDGVAAARNLITGKQVKDNSLTGRDVKDGSLLAKDFRKGTLPAGPAGPKGDTGTVDTSRFYGKAASDDRFLQKPHTAADSNLLDGLNSTAFLPAEAKAADADKLDGIDSTAFLLADGKAADTDKVDGIDSSAFVRGYGLDTENGLKASNTAIYSNRRHPNSGALLLRIPGFGIIEQSCKVPDGGPLASSVRFVNDSGGQLAVFGDDGGADPGYVVLQDGAATNYTAEREFDHIFFQIGRGNPFDEPSRTATVHITTVATFFHNFRTDCYGAAQAIAQTP